MVDKKTPEKKESQLQPSVVQKANSARFTEAVMKEAQIVGEVNLTSFQKKLIQNYFIKLDATIKDAEVKRKAKTYKQDPLPITWENVNVPKLALEVVALSSVGLDPLQPNHVNLMPFKNNANGNYDIVVIIGYRGLEIKATKYGLKAPDDVIIELVYDTDKFKVIKKDVNNPIECYTFEITNEFDRGKLVGGFYYHLYQDEPERNKLRVFNVHQIEKRKPKYASAEFWGGEKDKWVAGKKEGKETIEGWHDEMCWKTIYRSAYNDITIDSEKINASLMIFDRIEREQNEDKPELPETVKEEIKSSTASEEVEFEEVEDNAAAPEVGNKGKDEKAPY